ncbi:hypothetical protein BJX99DRAFT_266210 [Aspergillus californicus]
MATASQQRHHFIPRFILRKFAPNNQPPASLASSNRRRRRNYLVNKIDLENGLLTQRPVSTEFALVNMYRDPGFDENPYHLEKKLSDLESDASIIIQRATEIFAGRPVLSLARAEVDTLRKFLFLMKYRNCAMFDRYNHDDVQEYDADDRARMMRYMERRGFTKPRDVWFHNLKHMLDMEMDPARTWQQTLRTEIYPDDAMMFELHLLYSFMSFCQPVKPEEEFLLTENSFGIFEGPSSVRHDLISGKTEATVYTEYHNFAPIAPRLIIILRSHFLPYPGDTGADQNIRRSVASALRSMHLDPDRADSILQDLPIRPCKPVYEAPEITSPASFSKNDQFQFLCFKLSSAHITTINNLFLEQGYSTSSIVFHSHVYLRAAIEKYLQDQTPGLKSFVDRPGERRRTYLTTLEKVLRDLGGSGNCRIHPLDLSRARIRVHMALNVGFVVGLKLLMTQKRPDSLPRPYCLLKPESTRQTFWHDVDQASRLMMLRTKIDSALSRPGLSNVEKDSVRAQRQAFFMTFPPERLWVYFKISRNMCRCDVKDPISKLPELDVCGVEDDYAEGAAYY